jgi:tRNA:m4X modification enzyme
MAILSLRAYETAATDATKTESSLSELARGLAIATCCHHACVWEDYVGREWLEAEENFTKAEFNIMKLWCGWAHTLRTCFLRRKDLDNMTDEKAENEDENATAEHEVDATKITSVVRPEGVTYEGMSLTGLMCKRILDEGRVQYLRNVYRFEAHQQQFCSPVLSPECVAIIGRRKSN